MRRNASTLPLLAGLAFAFLAACSASTAHIGSLQIAKDKDLTQPTTTFGTTDTIYAKGTANNIPSKVTLKWQLIAEKVAGEPANEVIPSLEKSYDLPTDGDTTYNLTPPDKGWPPGTYKIVLTMMDDGQQRDQKTQEITIGSAGAGAGAAASPGAETSPEPSSSSQ